MSRLINSKQNNKTNKPIFRLRYVLLVGFAMFCTVWFATYVSNLLFNGKNSYKVYSVLKQQKGQLEYNIKKLQYENARLQKEYFELKNLEPEKGR